MTDPHTPTDAPDERLPAPEEGGFDAIGEGADIDDRPDEPTDEPVPPEDPE